MRVRPWTFAIAFASLVACARSQLRTEPDAALVDAPVVGSTGVRVVIDASAVNVVDSQRGDARDSSLVDAVVSGDVSRAPTNKVDLLLMIDNSNSMAEEQATIARELPDLVRALATGDVENDGLPDFPPVSDLHVGIVTSDLGSLDYGLPTCTTTFGDDGALGAHGNRALDGSPPCPGRFPNAFLSYQPGTPRDTFVRGVECMTVVGTGGCGFEQPLEAVLKALAPSTSPVRFLGTPATGPTLGQGDRANAGFLREDSVLAVVLLTDEEDCSVVDSRIFQVGGGPYNIDLNIRCSQYPEAQHPVSRYIAGLRALRTAHPERLVLSAIVGVPARLLPLTGETINYLDYEAILGDPSMQYRIDPASTVPNRMLVASCASANGVAFPPRRIVELLRELELGPNGALHSICEESYREASTALVTKIANALR